MKRVTRIKQHLQPKYLSTATMPPKDPVVIRQNQSVRHIELDKPRTLNALDSEMINIITRNIQAWSQSDLCKVIMMGSLKNSRAFCAGGDVKSVVNYAKVANFEKCVEFFGTEYRLNHLIATLKKPYISVMNGITMGGGVGLSIHGPFRIATENTVIAMPETSIGLFPDVGGSFFLPRMDGELGTFLGLTGHVLRGPEAFAAGFATHYMSSTKLDFLVSRLAELESDELATINGCIEEYAELPDSKFFQNWSLGGEIGAFINQAFKYNKMQDIFSALEKGALSSNTKIKEFAQKQIKTLQSVSPTSLKVTLEQLRRGSKMSIADCFKMEYRMARECCQASDFVEGVTAKMLEKRKPNWMPLKNDEASLVKFFNRRPDMDDLQLTNPLSYYDYPHRTLSGLPTDKDVQRVISGEGSRLSKVSPLRSREEVLAWFDRNWGLFDAGVIGNANSKALPKLVALDGGGLGRGKEGLREKVKAILISRTKENEGALEWIY